MKYLILGGLIAATIVHAGDTFPTLQTKDGIVYTNAEISSVTAAYAIVFYGSGSGAKVALTNLPDDLQVKYHYDPAKATAEIDAAAMKREAIEKARQDAVTAQQEALKDQMFRYVDGDAVPVSHFQQIHGKITQVTGNGIILDMAVQKYYRVAPSSYLQSIGGMPGPVPALHWESSGRMVFIRCPTSGLSDGQEWEAYCFSKGIFKYETVSGVTATVPKYDTGLSYGTRSDTVLRQLPPQLQYQSIQQTSDDGRRMRRARPSQ